MNPCKHGGVCDKFRCFCTDTAHYGPLCETGKKAIRRISVNSHFNIFSKQQISKTALNDRIGTILSVGSVQNWILNFQYVWTLTLGGDPWTAPVIWGSVYPSLHLSLDNAEPFTLHNGAQHVVTQV